MQPPLADINGHQVSAATDAKIQRLLANQRISRPQHLASELSKLLFTEELAACTLTGQKVNGQRRKILDAGKLCLIDNFVQQMCNQGEAEFAVIRSEIRDSLANCCRYLRRMLAPRDINSAEIEFTISINYWYSCISCFFILCCFNNFVFITITLILLLYLVVIMQCLYTSKPTVPTQISLSWENADSANCNVA